jgi:hypothetical protein
VIIHVVRVKKKKYKPQGATNKGMSMVHSRQGRLRDDERYKQLYTSFNRRNSNAPSNEQGDNTREPARKRRRATGGDELKGLSTDRSPVFNLGSISLPWSFPPDIMHLFYENIMHSILKVVCGDCYHSLSVNDRDSLNDMIHALNGDGNKVIEKFPEKLFINMGGQADKAVPYMKATAWKDFTEVFPFFWRRLPNKDKGSMYNILLELTLVMRILSQQEITEQALIVLDRAIPKLLLQFEKSLVGDSGKKIRKMTTPLHTLEHMPAYVRRTGPPVRHWAFAMERMCREAKMISSACRETSVAISNKVALRFLAQTFGMIGAHKSIRLKQSLKSEQQTNNDLDVIRRYVTRRAGSDFRFDHTDTVFLDRIETSKAHYLPRHLFAKKSRIAFRHNGTTKYGEISSLVKIMQNGIPWILAVVKSYKEDRLLRHSFDPTGLGEGDQKLEVSVYYENTIPERRDTFVTQLKDIISPIALLMDTSYPTNRGRLVEAVYYIHRPDGFPDGFSQYLQSAAM